MISTFQTKREEFEEVKSNIQNTAAEIEGIRQGVTSLQASTSQISSTLEKRFENLEIHQQNCLLQFREQFEELFNKFSENQSSGTSRSAEMQNSVSENNF